MATFAETMLAKYEELLKESAGLTSVAVDGQTITYGKLKAEYEHWRKRVLSEQGKAATVSTIKQRGLY